MFGVAKFKTSVLTSRKEPIAQNRSVREIAPDEEIPPEAPSSFAKGNAFKDYVESVLFPKTYYTLIHKTSSDLNNQDCCQCDMLAPDFKFLSRDNRHMFWVETKWRQQLFKGTFSMCESQKLKQYHKTSEQCPLLILVGLGGSPHSPVLVSLIPFNMAQGSSYHHCLLQKYQIHRDEPVSIPQLEELLWAQFAK